MKVGRFNPADDLIVVKARLYGPRGDRPLSLAFDTAATETHIVPEIVDDLGYSPRQGEAITSVRSAIGKEQATCCVWLGSHRLGSASLTSLCTFTISLRGWA
jgi:hypothetical protein